MDTESNPSYLANADNAATAEEQRRSYRYPVQPDQAPASMLIGRKEYEVTLVEESAGGFTVVTTQRIPLGSATSVRLTVYSGLFQVELVHVCPGEDGCRIGLRRIRALDEEGKQGMNLNWLNPCRLVAKLILGKTLAFVLFMLLGAAVTLLITGKMSLSEWIGGELNLGGAARRVAIVTEPALKRPDLDVANVLEGINSLTEPRIAARVRLTPQQTRNMDSIFTDASTALAELYDVAGDKSPEVWRIGSAKIVDLTVQRVITSLTDEQIKEWRRLLNAPK